MAYVGSSDGGEIYINGVGLEPQLLVLHDLVQEVLYEVLNFTQELGFRSEGLKRERVWRDEVKARESFREFWVLSLKGLGKRRIGVEYLIAYPTKRIHSDQTLRRGGRVKSSLKGDSGLGNYNYWGFGGVSLAHGDG